LEFFEMFKKAAAVIAFSLVSLQAVHADTIIKFDLGDTGPDLQYVAGQFSTINEGNALTFGDQDTGIDFTSFLDPILVDIVAGASFTLSGVNAVGGASVLGSLVLQQTEGGTFSIWNEANELLLAAELGEGVITGSIGVSTGSFFNTSIANFTGGSLLEYIATSPAGISIALANILTDGIPGVAVGGNNQLFDFTADADGLITGEPVAVSEPATAVLLGAAGIAGLIRRRRK